MESGYFKAALWDIDDILVDTKAFQRKTQISVLNTLGVTKELERFIELWDHLLWYFHQDDYLGIVKAIIKETSLIVDDTTISRAVEIGDSVWEQPIPILDFIEDMLRYLKNKSIILGIISNGDLDEQLTKVARAKLGDYFLPENIFIGPSRKPGSKPNPDLILQFCHNTGCVTSNVFYVGDRTIDVIAANLAGVTSILVERQAPESKEPSEFLTRLEKPDHRFETHRDLYAWITNNS